MPNTGSNWISEVRFDERGRPYRVYLMDGPGYRAGERAYVPPAEAVASDDPRLRQWGEQNGAPGQSFLRERGTWNSRTGEWDRGINWSNIASAATGALIGAPYLAGIGGAGPAAGPSAGSAGSTLPASSVPLGTAMTATPATAGMVSQGASLGGVMPAVAGGNAITRFLRDNAGTLAGIGIPAAAAALSSPGGGSNELPAELKRILAMAEARTRRSDPLHQAAVQMAFGALPTYGRAGINLPKVELP